MRQDKIYIKHCHAGEVTNIKHRKRTGDCDFEKKHPGDWKQKHSVLDLLEKTTKKSKFQTKIFFILKKVTNKKTTE